MRWKLLFWFLVVIFCAVLSFRIVRPYLRPHATGFMLEVGSPNPPEDCELKVPLMLHVSTDRALRLGNEALSPDQLARWLDLILRERTRPVLYVDANPEMTMQEFVQVLDLVKKTNEKVAVRLITPGNRKYSCIDVPPGRRAE